jgi:hypothetical protein
MGNGRETEGKRKEGGEGKEGREEKERQNDVGRDERIRGWEEIGREEYVDSTVVRLNRSRKQNKQHGTVNADEKEIGQICVSEQ